MPHLSWPPPGAGPETRLTCPTGSHPGALDCEADLTDWTAGPKLAHKRDHHVTFVATTPAGSFLYVVGGAGAGGTVKQIERAAFDGKVVSPWERVAPLPGPLTHHASIVYNNAIYVIGGGVTVAALPDIVRVGARNYFHVFFSCQISHFILWWEGL